MIGQCLVFDKLQHVVFTEIHVAQVIVEMEFPDRIVSQLCQLHSLFDGGYLFGRIVFLLAGFSQEEKSFQFLLYLVPGTEDPDAFLQLFFLRIEVT